MNEYGERFDSGNPRMFFKGTETIFWQLFSETPEMTGLTQESIEENWTKYTGYKDINGICAYLTADSNYTQKLKGVLVNEIAQGEIVTIKARINNASFSTIPQTGILTLFDGSGEAERFEYLSRQITNGDILFVLADGSSTEKIYSPSNASIDVDESVYMQASLDYSQSDISNGLFAFVITAYSEKLRNEIEYSNIKELEVTGLELAIFRNNSEDGTITDLERYVTDSFVIRSGIANTNTDVPVSDKIHSDIVMSVGSMLSGGFEVEYSVDGLTNWHSERNIGYDLYYRFRSATAKGEWSSAIYLERGDHTTVEAGTFTILEPTAIPIFTERITETGVALDIGMPAGQKGDKGDMPVLNFTAETSADSQTTAEVTETGVGYDVLLKIPKGEKGNKGDSATITIGTVETVEPNIPASIKNTGTSSDAVFDFSIPKGEKGDKGETFKIDAVGTESDKSLYDSESTGFAFLNTTDGCLYIMKEDGVWGDPIPFKGDKGDMPVITATASTLESGVATVETITTEDGYQINFGIPKGNKGDTPTINIGTVETLETGEQASVTNSGTKTSVVLDFKLPKGNSGTTPTVAIGTVSTIESTEQASVVNSGTNTNVVLDFKLPKGEKGDTGTIENKFEVVDSLPSEGTKGQLVCYKGNLWEYVQPTGFDVSFNYYDVVHYTLISGSGKTAIYKLDGYNQRFIFDGKKWCCQTYESDGSTNTLYYIFQPDNIVFENPWDSSRYSNDTIIKFTNIGKYGWNKIKQPLESLNEMPEADIEKYGIVLYTGNTTEAYESLALYKAIPHQSVITMTYVSSGETTVFTKNTSSGDWEYKDSSDTIVSTLSINETYGRWLLYEASTDAYYDGPPCNSNDEPYDIKGISCWYHGDYFTPYFFATFTSEAIWVKIGKLVTE